MIFSLFFRCFLCINIIFLDICGRKRNYVISFLIALNANKPKHWILFRLGLVVGSLGLSTWTDGYCTMFKYDSHFCRRVVFAIPRRSWSVVTACLAVCTSVLWGKRSDPSLLSPSLATCELWLSSTSSAHVSGCWIQRKHSISEQNHLLIQWWIKVGSLFTLTLLKRVTALRA